jgi:hypothetical protein
MSGSGARAGELQPEPAKSSIQRRLRTAFHACACLPAAFIHLRAYDASGPPFAINDVRLPCSALSHAKASVECRLFCIE